MGYPKYDTDPHPKYGATQTGVASMWRPEITLDANASRRACRPRRTRRGQPRWWPIEIPSPFGFWPLPPLPPRPQADEAGAQQEQRGGFWYGFWNEVKLANLENAQPVGSPGVVRVAVRPVIGRPGARYRRPWGPGWLRHRRGGGVATPARGGVWSRAFRWPPPPL